MRSTDMRGRRLNGPNLEERLARMPKDGAVGAPGGASVDSGAKILLEFPIGLRKGDRSSRPYSPNLQHASSSTSAAFLP